MVSSVQSRHMVSQRKQQQNHHHKVFLLSMQSLIPLSQLIWAEALAHHGTEKAARAELVDGKSTLNWY